MSINYRQYGADLVIGKTKVTNNADRGLIAVGNVQYGILFKYEDGTVDLYVYEDEAAFNRHAPQFRQWESIHQGRILWASKPPRE